MSEQEIVTTPIVEKQGLVQKTKDFLTKTISDQSTPYDEDTAIKKIEETYEPSILPGVMDKVDRKVFTDQRKLKGYVDVRDVLNLDNKEIQDEVMAYKGYVPEGTAAGAGKVIPFTGTTIEERIKELNLGQAVAFADKDNKTTAIPFEIGLAEYEKTPQGYDPEMIFGLPVGQTIQEVTGFPLDEVGGKLVYVRRLNSKLRKLGVSPRSRYGIIKYRMENLDQGFLNTIFDPAFNDFTNAKGYLKRGIRDTIQGGVFIFGEIFDAFNQEYDKTYTPFGDISDPIPETLIEDSIKRDKFFENILPQQASLIQDHFANMGIILTLPQADMLARDFSNLPSRGLAVASEIVLPTKGAAYLQKLRAVGFTGKGGELAFFEKFKVDQLKKNPKLTDSELVTMYNSVRETQIGKTDLFSPVFDIPIIGRIGKKINGFVNAGRLASGFDVKMATEAVKGRNPAIVNSQLRLDNAKEDVANFKAKYPKGKGMDLNAMNKLEELEKSVDTIKIEHRALVHAEHIPKFMREVAGQNKYIIIGSAAMGQLAENTDGDVAMHEMIGLFGGLLYSQGRTFRATMRAMKNNLGGKETRDARKTFDLAQQMAENINTFSPQFREVLMSRIRYFDEIQQNLIKAGVKPEVLNRSFSRITGLTVLQTLEEAERLDISSKDLRHFSNLENLQEIAEQKQILINELAGISTSLATLPKSKMDNAAVDQFYNLIQQTKEHAEGRLKKLNADIETVESNFKLRVDSMIKGNTEIFPAIGEDSTLQLNDALESLYKLGVKKVDLNSVAKRVQKASDTSKAVTNSVNNAINAINGQHNLKEALELTKKVTGRKDITATKKTIPTFERGGNLLAVLGENNKNKSYYNSTINYKVLDNTEFVDRLGNKVGRNATTDGTSIVQKIFDNAELIDFQDIASTSINQSKRARILNALEGVGDNTFEKIRAGTGASSVNEVVNGILAEAKDFNFTVPKNRPKLRALEYLSKKTGTETIALNFDQLNELKHSVRKLQYQASDSGNMESARVLQDLNATIMENFTAFRVESVTPQGKKVVRNIKELFVEVDGRRVSALNFMAEGDAKYKKHMERFYENPVVSEMLGLGKKGGRKRIQPDADYPVGLIYKKDPLTWLDFNKISKMNPSTDGAVFNKKINEGFGTLDNPLGVARINVDTDEGRASQKAIQLIASEWLIDIYKKKELNFNQLKDLTDNITANLQGINSKGKKVALVNFDDVIDNKIGFAPQNVGEDVYKSAKTRAENVISSELRKIKNEVKELNDDIKKTLDIVDKYNAQKMDSKSIVESLLGGGETRITEIKNAMRKQGINGNKINSTLGNLFITEIDKSVFNKTGRMIVGGKNNDSLIPEYDMDIASLEDLIGFKDPTKQRLVKNIIGKKKYDFYKDMITFLKNEELRTIKNANFTGIPKNLSIESYISRFYSINRGVVSARYVGTEAVLQQYRLRNHSMFKALMLNEEAGQLFLKMVRTGKPLSPKEDIRFGNLMAVMLARGIGFYQENNRAVELNLGEGYQFRVNAEISLRDDPRIISRFDKDYEDVVRNIPIRTPFKDGMRIIDEKRR